jgi:F0F1-type ATP synthase assembly protein I
MASVSHEPATYAPRRPQWAELLKIRELWASLAIGMMWLAVLFDAVFGPNFVSTSSGGNSTTIPSAVFVALFAFLASSAVAKHAFRQGKQ